jgi:MoaA/NifB/PqqE/SkfB family radical SAM enzyme
MNIYRFHNAPKFFRDISIILLKMINRIRIFPFQSGHDQKYKRYNQNRLLGPQKQVCYAPARSLYFGRDGNVIACCLNRSHVMGNITKDTITQIWTGKRSD